MYFVSLDIRIQSESCSTLPKIFFTPALKAHVVGCHKGEQRGSSRRRQNTGEDVEEWHLCWMQETACFFPQKKLHGKVGKSIKGRLVCKQRNHFYSVCPVSFVRVSTPQPFKDAYVSRDRWRSRGLFRVFKYTRISPDANPEDIYDNLCCTLLLTLLLVVYY